MQPGFLLLGDLPQGLNLRVQRFANICRFPLRRIKAGNSSLGDLQDVEILVSWGLDINRLIEHSLALKSQIGDIPLLWLNESILDERIQAKVTAAHCDGFLEISELEAIITDIYKIDKLTDLTKISGLKINQKRQPGLIKIPRNSSRRNIHEVFGMLDPKQKVDFQGYYPMLFDLGSTFRYSHSATTSIEGFRRGVGLEQRIALLKQLCQLQRIRKFHFYDQEMNADLDLLREFCEQITEHGLKFNFKTGFQFKPMCENLFNLLVEAGLEQVTLTLFSGSDQILEQNNIGMRLSQMSKNLQQFDAVGVDVHLKIFVGMPGEKYDDYFLTLEFLRKNARYIKSVETVKSLVLEPNSPVYRTSNKLFIKLNPGEPNSWVKKEEDHLNDFKAREQKRVFMLRQAQILGLYSQGVDMKADLAEIQKMSDDFEKPKVNPPS